MTHTKGPYRVVGNGVAVAGRRGEGEILRATERFMCRGEREANAKRAADCMNALAGLNPDAVADVVAALEECLNYVTNTEGELGIALDCGDRARTALARIRGEG